MSRFILASIKCCLKVNGELLHLKEEFGIDAIFFRINIFAQAKRPSYINDKDESIHN